MCAESLSCVRLFATLWTVTCQAPLSMGFSRQEHWSGLPCPPPRGSSWYRDRTHVSLSPALAARFLTAVTPGKPRRRVYTDSCASYVRCLPVCISYVSYVHSVFLSAYRVICALSLPVYIVYVSYVHSVYLSAYCMCHMCTFCLSVYRVICALCLSIYILYVLYIHSIYIFVCIIYTLYLSTYCTYYIYALSTYLYVLYILYLSTYLYVLYTLHLCTYVFLATPWSMWDLSSQTRDQTDAPCYGIAESLPLDHQGSPWKEYFRRLNDMLGSPNLP